PSGALEWSDIDFVKRQVCVQRSAWKGQIASPKGGRLRYIPLTTRLAGALRDHRHLRGPLVLYQDDGSSLTEGIVDSTTMDHTCCAIPSARISRCAALPREPFRNSPDIKS